jgi:glutaredoxin|tara:strand:- start:1077 stop:1298 length:222 start_codon:yes stop_codon:yes gene_type:complete
MKNIVWSKVPCGFCEAAKTLLKSKNIEFEERMIGKEWTMEQFLEDVPGAKTVPQIILDGKLIGTYEDLKNHLK